MIVASLHLDICTHCTAPQYEIEPLISQNHHIRPTQHLISDYRLKLLQSCLPHYSWSQSLYYLCAQSVTNCSNCVSDLMYEAYDSIDNVCAALSSSCHMESNPLAVSLTALLCTGELIELLHGRIQSSLHLSKLLYIHEGHHKTLQQGEESKCCVSCVKIRKVFMSGILCRANLLHVRNRVNFSCKMLC